MSPFNPSALKKILVIQTASIGDVILATPVVEALHRSYPDASIDLLVKKGAESLFDGHPFLHKILVWDKAGNKFAGLHKLTHIVRETKYSLVVNLQRFASTGLLTAFSGASTTIGFDKNPFSLFFTKRVKHLIEPGIHEVNRNLDLVREYSDGKEDRPRLYPPVSTTLPFSPVGSGPVYTISPGSLWFTKQFPKEKWTELINAIPRDATVVLLGSGSDRPLCQEISVASAHPGLINLAGERSFLESAAIMQHARMNFTNDSAPMHLASAVNAPVTVVYCSTVPAFGFGPLSADAVIVETEEPLACRPCGLHGRRLCPEHHFRCALDIPIHKLTSRL